MIDTISTGGNLTNIATKVSGGNSTSVPLTAGSLFTGAWEVVENFTSLICSLKTDQVGILYIEFSIDGLTADSSTTYAIEANVDEIHRVTVTRKYFRMGLLNASASDQTYLRIQTIYGNFPMLTQALNHATQPDADALLTKSILYGNDSGSLVPINSPGGDLNVGGTFVPSGLRVRMKVTNMTVTDTETPLPLAALAARNSIIIENKGVDSIFIGETGVSSTGINEGWEISASAFFSTDVTDAIVIYAIAPAGKTVNVKILELA